MKVRRVLPKTCHDEGVVIAHAELISQSQYAAGGSNIGVAAPAFLVIDGLHLARGTYLAVFDAVHVVLFIGNHSAGFDGFAQLGAGIELKINTTFLLNF